MKLRLFLFPECNRSCEGCCNQYWDIQHLPICTDYKGYELIMLTGGEPMLKPLLVQRAIKEIREQTLAPIYLYTAYVNHIHSVLAILEAIEGLTLTLHEQADVAPYEALDAVVPWTTKSLRLNVFEGVDISHSHTFKWVMKEHVQWIKNCPLPEGEVFMQYKQYSRGYSDD